VAVDKVMQTQADLVTVSVPVGGRVLIVSELHLTRDATPASTLATTEVAQAIDAWTGPGLLVFNGDCIEMLAGGAADPRASLTAHPKLVASVKDFAAGAGRRVLYLPGTRDGRAAWDPKVAAALRDVLGAEIGLAAELHIDTGAGPRIVRVEPGHQLDPLACFSDPRNPADSPLGQHLVCDVLPALGGTGPGSPVADDGWLAGLGSLDDPAAFPRFLASRLAYRRLGRHAWWLLLPLLAAVVLRLPFAFVRAAHTHVASAGRLILFIGIATVLDLALVGVVAAVAIRRTWTALAGVALSRLDDRDDPNGPARALARDLVTAGHAGLVTGHTRHPELAHLGSGFYANTGCACEVVSETPSRLDSIGMPSLFLGHRQVAWIELEAGNELHVRLLYGRQDLAGSTVVERVMARPHPESRTLGSKELHPAVVATFPQGASWPPPVEITPRLQRIRRRAAVLVAMAGILSLVSAFVQPAQDRLQALLKFIPLAVPEAADALVALGSMGLLILARGVRRGQRHAWLICEGLLVGTAVLHLVKGVDVEEAVIALAVAAYLFVNRDAFKAGVDVPSATRGVLTLLSGLAVAVVAGTIGIEIGTALSRSRHYQRFPLPRALFAAAERLVGIRTVVLPDRLDDFVAPAILTVAIGLGLAAAWLFFRPVVARRAHGGGGGGGDNGLVKARDIVRRHGSGTLDYFAVRSDKQFFFWGDSMVAYGVYGGVCLVSPDPIGPRAEREETWKAFRRFADEQGWTLAVLGAGEEWLPTYRSSGMHDLYVGDEAVVDCERFTLEGGRYKGLRQAVNRIAKYGYTTTFHDPARLTPALRGQLETVMTKSRRGDVERGFSMTLGRAFDPDDEGLLLAVVHGPSGDAVAFCQYVPANGIDGYSLDLMRRDDGDHPNGLLDFAIVETIRYLRQQGRRGLGLNFATMRAVLAGEAGEGMSQRIQAWLLRRMSDSMQIESLWKFNAKYDPDWQPRYALYDSPEHALPAAIAVARAESFWELPVIGRFLVPSDRGVQVVPTPAEPAEGGESPAEPAAIDTSAQPTEGGESPAEPAAIPPDTDRPLHQVPK
jgi:lysylphosphatidylglycerol synthetase-like protein (DUF2156 family)